MKSSRRIPRPVDGDECGVGVRGMQSPLIQFFKMPRPVGGVIHLFIKRRFHLQYRRRSFRCGY